MKKVEMVFKGVANSMSFFESSNGGCYKYLGQFNKRKKGDRALVIPGKRHTLISVQWVN